jgi:hypothetical protein
VLLLLLLVDIGVRTRLPEDADPPLSSGEPVLSLVHDSYGLKLDLTTTSHTELLPTDEAGDAFSRWVSALLLFVGFSNGGISGLELGESAPI